jgi:hypothetical protein
MENETETIPKRELKVNVKLSTMSSTRQEERPLNMGQLTPEQRTFVIKRFTKQIACSRLALLLH